MAANPNRPVDFIHGQSKEIDETVLIPPSEFEKPPSSNWKDLKKAKTQIQDLLTENEKLRQMHCHLKNQAAPISFSSSHEYADELIKRQAGEIAELKSELMKCRQTYEQDAGEWNRRFSLQEEEHEQEVKRLERHISRKEDDYEQKLSRLNAELHRAHEEAEAEVTSLNSKLDTARLTLTERVKELEEQLRSMQEGSRTTIQKLESDLRIKSTTIEDQAHQLSKLKIYIGETEQAYKPAQILKTEKETVDNKLRLAQAENQKFQSQLELIDVRFKALNDILTVQESELSKAKAEGLGRPKQHNLLLTRWREKVYLMLIQQKSTEIVYKNDLHNSNQKIQNLADQLAASKAEAEVLQHSLRDKSALLQLEINNKERLQLELGQTHQVAVCLDDQCKESLNSVKSLTEFAEKSKHLYDEMMQKLEEKSHALKVLGQRVSFAASRMDILKTQLMRKTAITSSLTDDLKQSVPISKEKEGVSRNNEEHLYQELEKVMKERDSLATQVREDTAKWMQRLAETQSQYVNEISTLRRTVEDLEYDILQKSKMCAELEEELQGVKEDIEIKDATIAQQQTELTKHAKGIEAVLTDQRLKIEAEWSEKLATMDRKLNDSKREHTKAVVSLRQLERKHARDLEKHQELLNTTEEYWSRQLQKLQNKLLSVEKERNIMMTTLRQEGLINKLKTDRGEPIQLTSLDDLKPPTGSVGERNSVSKENLERREKSRKVNPTDREKEMNAEALVSPQHSKEPVEHVLEDLKHLSAAIFDEDDDDDDKENSAL